jgi:hypothetical protein
MAARETDCETSIHLLAGITAELHFRFNTSPAGDK